MSNNVVGSVPDVTTIFIQLVDEDPNISRLRNEHAVIDAIQRHRTWSPHAMGIWSIVCDPSSRSWIAPWIKLEEHVACGLTRLLGMNTY